MLSDGHDNACASASTQMQHSDHVETSLRQTGDNLVFFKQTYVRSVSTGIRKSATLICNRRYHPSNNLENQKSLDWQ